MKKYKEEAQKAFSQKKYDLALKFYSLALKVEPNNIDLKVGAILSDFAKEDEAEAIALQDFYFSSIHLGDDKERVYKEIVDSIEYEENILASIIDSINNLTDSFENGVEYNDFLAIAKKRGDIKRSLEDIMFSARIIINSKEDMMDFIALLFKYDFKDEALIYLENAINIYPGDTYFEEKFRELSKRNIS
jgi:tetratricopeptide (TPR) repeat protein